MTMKICTPPAKPVKSRLPFGKTMLGAPLKETWPALMVMLTARAESWVPAGGVCVFAICTSLQSCRFVHSRAATRSARSGAEVFERGAELDHHRLTFSVKRRRSRRASQFLAAAATQKEIKPAGRWFASLG